MEVRQEGVRIKGKMIDVDSINIDNKTIIATGSLFRLGSLEFEWDSDIDNPPVLLDHLRASNLKVDMFTFMQRLPDTSPKFDYYMEWDNVAVIPLTTYEQWYKKRIQENSRHKIRKAKRVGVEIKLVKFDDELVKGISEIYNEVPIRQGKPFWHYGKDLDSLKEIHSTFLERSDFIGAFYQNKLIGFLKLVYTDRYVRTMHILSKIEHRDKGPTNALLAKAIEICCEKKIPYLVYGAFDYGKTGSKSLSDFKKHMGFEKVLLPRYFIPLNSKGRMMLKVGLHHGIVGLLPEKVVRAILKLREIWYTEKYKKERS